MGRLPPRASVRAAPPARSPPLPALPGPPAPAPPLPPNRIAQTLQDAVDAGASHIAGYRVERLAASGEAARVAAAARADAGDEVVSLFRQFPLRCRAAAAPDPGGADAEPPGADARVVAFRNYFRAARGGRAVVAPDDARTYFGSCSGGAPPPCRGRGGAALGLPADLWNITPYAVHEDHYLYRHTPPDAHGGKKFGLWRPGLYAEAAIPVHHFRWHAGGAGALAARLARLAGPGCAPDAPDAPGCAPLTRRWRAAARRAAALAAGGAVDLAGWECAMPRPGQEVPVDTTYQGLAWEQFEEALKVVSRVRNVAKGDSQSRMASKLGAGGGGGTAADVLKAVLAESGGGREAAAAEGGAAAGGAAAAAGGAAPALGGAGGGGGEEA